MRECYAYQAEALIPNYSFDIEGEMQLADRAFDDEFPNGPDADENFVGRVGNCLQRTRGERRQVGYLPNESMSVEQQSHNGRSKSSISSSVNSKSGDIQTCPLSFPGLRGSGFLGTGTRRTSGVPLRPMMTSSPASARWTRRDSV